MTTSRQTNSPKQFTEQFIDRLPTVLRVLAIEGLRGLGLLVIDWLKRKFLGKRNSPPTLKSWPVDDMPLLSQSDPKVSIIIPTRDKVELLKTCVSGCLQDTAYPEFEIIILDNGSEEAETLNYLSEIDRDPRVTVLPAPGLFNFSKLINQGASKATGDYLLLLNNDTQVMESNWLREMTSLANRSDVGAVGARLWYPDGRLQHAGLALDPYAIAYSPFDGQAVDLESEKSSASSAFAYPAVTGACMLVSQHHFEEAGRMNDTDLKVAFNDVDLCLRLSKMGLTNLCCANANLVHVELASRGSDRNLNARFLRERAYMRRKWWNELSSGSA